MANRQIDPDGPYNWGYADYEQGNPRNCPWFDKPSVDAYRNGYNTAKRSSRSPL